MNKIEILKEINFGERIAEDESNELIEYFVSTESWRRLYNNEVDIIYGPKGSGKSALYSILEKKTEELFDKNILLVPAENPRGNTAFSDLVTDPPISEKEFISLWKLYFLIIINNQLESWDIEDENTKELKKVLSDANLIPPENNLRTFLQTAKEYMTRLIRPKEIEAGVGLEEGIPKSLNFKVTPGEPSNEQKKEGIRSINYLFDLANKTLANEDYQLWVIIDRLDVAFSENIELENNALRALFKAYSDLKGHDNIVFKIFLRDDIWNRITTEGFREASHISRTFTIEWQKESLVNLIISRLLKNEVILNEYDLKKGDILQNIDKQKEVFDMIFPDQIDIGQNKPSTIEWILSRVRDGNDDSTPREIIHLLNEAVREQISRIEVGQDTQQNELIGRNAIKKALDEVSKVKLEQTLYAEYPQIKKYIQSLEGEKSEQTISTLSEIWGLDEQNTIEKINKLLDIGFFEEKRSEPDLNRYWIPFLFRNHLGLIQGKAE